MFIKQNKLKKIKGIFRNNVRGRKMDSQKSSKHTQIYRKIGSYHQCLLALTFKKMYIRS